MTTPAVPEEIVEIRGNLVTTYKRETIRSIPLAELLPQLAEPEPWASPRMPKGIAWVYINETEGRVVMVVERTPGLRNFHAAGMRTALRLMVPYEYFVIDAVAPNSRTNNNWALHNWWLFWSNERLPNLDGNVIPAPIPNVNSEGMICFGTTAPNSHLTLADRIDTLINGFYNSDFNRDYGWKKPSRFRSYAEWATESRDAPNAWMTWDEWQSAHMHSLRSRIRNLPQRATETVMTGSIPNYQRGLSFGAAAEWFSNLDPTDRTRLVRGIRDMLPTVGLALPQDESWEEEDLQKFLDTEKPEAPVAVRPPTPILSDEDNFGGSTDYDSDEDDEVWFNCVCGVCFCAIDDLLDPNTICAPCQEGEHGDRQ